jgi:hypothetical protein
LRPPFFLKKVMGDRRMRTIIAGAALLACVATSGSAVAWDCLADPLRNLKAGETHTIKVKVKKGALCQYTFFNNRSTMHGARILQKPASARMIANGYAVAYSFTQVGNYTAKIQMNFARGPVTVVMAVQVVPESF